MQNHQAIIAEILRLADESPSSDLSVESELETGEIVRIARHAASSLVIVTVVSPVPLASAAALEALVRIADRSIFENCQMVGGWDVDQLPSLSLLMPIEQVSELEAANRVESLFATFDRLLSEGDEESQHTTEPPEDGAIGWVRI